MKKLFCLLSLTFLATVSSICHAETSVLAFAGSTREGSYNKLLVKEAAEMAEKMGAKVKFIDLKNFTLPFFDEDLEREEGMPQKAKELRKLLIESQVIFIASPEYNGSVPAVLKNILDWSSRNEDGKPSREAFKGKKFLLLSASPGKGGGARGLVHLKAIIEDVGGQVMRSQFSLPSAYQAFDSNGHLKDSKSRTSLQNLVREALK